MAKKYLDKQKYRDDLKKLKLSSEENEKAQELLDQIDEGEISSPQDFLDEWKDLDFGRPKTKKRGHRIH